ncbi:MAG: ligase-associated DNA damage response exonuclease [Pseudomonadota bacterium]
MRPDDLLHPRPEGLYCPPGDFYIDPVRPVPRAMITHGHADHARAGHGAVMATRRTLEIMAIRYGADFAGSRQEGTREAVEVNGVKVSFHPAGHILGSAQVRVEHKGLTIVAAGDYKRGVDPTAEVFEPVPCDVFITEATFGLPVFRHPDPKDEIAKLFRSLAENPERAHLVGVYSLGKAQRIIRLLRDNGWDRPIYIHGSLASLCAFYEAEGVALGDLRPATIDRSQKAQFAGEVVLAPPSTFAAKWAQRFPEPLIAFASGWMQIRARARQRGVELPMVISDHCDWAELGETIKELSPEEVWVTHGREEALVRWCALNQIAARPLNLVGYEDEQE